MLKFILKKKPEPSPGLKFLVLYNMSLQSSINCKYKQKEPLMILHTAITIEKQVNSTAPRKYPAKVKHSIMAKTKERNKKLLLIRSMLSGQKYLIQRKNKKQQSLMILKEIRYSFTLQICRKNPSQKLRQANCSSPGLMFQQIHL